MVCCIARTGPVFSSGNSPHTRLIDARLDRRGGVGHPAEDVMQLDQLLQDVSADTPSGPFLASDAQYLEVFRLARGKPERFDGKNTIPAEEPRWSDLVDPLVRLCHRTRGRSAPGADPNRTRTTARSGTGTTTGPGAGRAAATSSDGSARRLPAVGSA